MLQAELIMFSRTLSCDYRWIYKPENINNEALQVIKNDFFAFTKNKELMLSKNHIYVRLTADSIAIYGFCKSKYQDENSRSIFALVGLVFSNFDFQIVVSLLDIVTASLFSSFNTFIDCDKWDTTDYTVNQQFLVDISLDELILQCKTNTETNSLMKRIFKSVVSEPFDFLDITCDNIKASRMQINKNDSETRKENGNNNNAEDEYAPMIQNKRRFALRWFADLFCKEISINGEKPNKR